MLQSLRLANQYFLICHKIYKQYVIIIALRLINFLYYYNISKPKIEHMKNHSKKPTKFSYPHPIPKVSLTPTPTAQPQTTPTNYAYQYPLTYDHNNIPHKFLQSTHLEPLIGSSFSLLVHPLHPRVEVGRYAGTGMGGGTGGVGRCGKCGAVFNAAAVELVGLWQCRCRVCGGIAEKLASDRMEIDQNLFDIVNDFQIMESNHVQPKKILFVIQANQFIYEKQVSISIFQCLKALKQPPTPQLNKQPCQQTTQQSQKQHSDISPPHKTPKIGFILYNNHQIHTLNMQTLQLSILRAGDFNFKQQSQFPLTESELLGDLDEIDLGAVEAIVMGVLYGAYLIGEACVGDVLGVGELAVRMFGVQVKMFMYSYKQVVNQDTIKKNSSKTKTQQLKIPPQIQIYLLNHKLYKKYCSIGLKDNIYKVYEYQNLCPTEIYYNLYHNLTQQVYYNVGVEVRSSSFIISNKQKIVVPVISSNSSVTLDFGVSSEYKRNQKQSFQQILCNQLIQIKINFGKFERVVTYKVPKISTKMPNQPYLLNDEVFFYVMVCKLLADKNTSLKQSLMIKCKQIVKKVLNLEQNQFYIPKNLTNFFMYAFMILQHQISDRRLQNFQYDKNVFMREGLETIVKKIYPKVYEFYPQIRPLKFRPKSFTQDTIRLIDNGTFLGIVFGDQVKKQTIWQVLGTKNINQATNWKDIPVLDNQINKKLHESIAFIRDCNEQYFLPISIIKLDSQQFQYYYGNYLYIEEDHCKFFSACFKS